MRPGVRYGVDVGAVRVGVASCDPDGLIATPVATLRRNPGADADVAEVARRAAEQDALEVVVGLPLNMSGSDTASTQAAREWAAKLKRLAPDMRVTLVDERLTSVSAHGLLHESGVAGRQHRSRVDQQAAVLILQAALDAERAQGRPVGQGVGERKPRTRSRRAHSEGGTNA